ncbi:proto-oncogene tyrosine-protein kinase LCK-like [Clytia hemisphaerica]|uniref:proto-oncogene tyrosine-protein kinase LCK-like n=1 Tax=Clytia hemisphaerica TaxID=252671 RepID=UPI0034D3DCA8
MEKERLGQQKTYRSKESRTRRNKRKSEKDKRLVKEQKEREIEKKNENEAKIMRLERETEEIASGVFGVVKKGFIKSTQQAVAVKELSEKSDRALMLAEASLAMEMSGSKWFPYLFGIVEPKKLLFEFVDGRTLREIVKHGLGLNNWHNICLKLIRGLHALHTRGFLHNDLHIGNVMIRSGLYVKIIDFGKCTSIEDPVVYSIKRGSDRHKRYNVLHRHLAHELHNVPGSSVSVASDIYSLGYLFDTISDYVKSPHLGLLSTQMINLKPEERPSLPSVLLQLSKF